MDSAQEKLENIVWTLTLKLIKVIKAIKQSLAAQETFARDLGMVKWKGETLKG